MDMSEINANQTQNEDGNAVEITPFMKSNGVETKPKRTNSKNLSLYFSQFCGSTSIHGIQYLGQRGRYLIEKLVWLIIVVTVCTLCIILIRKTYIKWQTSPVIVTFSTTEMPISDIPFPAVTICPDAKFDPEVFNFTDVVIKKLLSLNTTEDEENLFSSVSMVCSCMSELNQLIDLNGYNKTLEDYMMLPFIMVRPTFDPNDATEINWLGKKLDIEEGISTVFTSDGVCYTFNMLPYEELLKEADDYITSNTKSGNTVRKWSLDYGYPPGDDFDTYPRRTFLSGLDGGLHVEALFTNHSHIDYLCDQSVQGYKVVLHHPSELPDMEKHFRVPLDQAVFVSVKPTMITVSEDLLDYKPEDRKCYFSQERPLAMYHHYTQQNCLMECLANYTLAHCGCLAFYMPSFNDSKICGIGSLKCVRESKVKYMEHESDDGTKGKCGCMPSCTSLTYDVETSQTDWNWRQMFHVFRRIGLSEFFPKEQESHFSRLTVYYKDLQFLTSQRNELYGYVDFFSNIGGLLGLFIGFSVTSAIEILYFLSLRLICNIKKYGRGVWSGEPELMNSKDE